MPKTEGTNPEMQIAAALDSIGIHQDAENADGLSYQMGFRIDETGYRRKKYDLAVLKHGHPKLLIEYDGNYEIVCMFAYPRPKKTTSCPATGIAEVVFYGINYESPAGRYDSTSGPGNASLYLGTQSFRADRCACAISIAQKSSPFCMMSRDHCPCRPMSLMMALT